MKNPSPQIRILTALMLPDTYMKVKRMGMKEILRRIWLLFAYKTKSSEAFSKQLTQLIVKLNSSLRHIIVTQVWQETHAWNISNFSR